MNKTIKIILSVVIVALAVLVGVYAYQSGKPSVKVGDNSHTVGGYQFALSTLGDSVSVGNVSPMTTISGNQGNAYFGGGWTDGGGVFSTTTGNSVTAATLPPNSLVATTSTQTGASIVNDSYNMISITPMNSGLTVTFPASSTFVSPYLQNTGDVDTVWIENATTTNVFAPGFILAPGTGETMTVASSTATTTSFTVGYLQARKLEIVRMPTTVAGSPQLGNINIIAY